MAEPVATAAEQVSLPTAELVKVSNHISLLPPLSRKGHGPGLVIVLPADTPSYTDGGVVCENGIPPPLLKWAEEGFAVVEIRGDTFTGGSTTATTTQILAKALTALEGCEKCDFNEGVGMVVYDTSIWNELGRSAAIGPTMKAAVIYGTAGDLVTPVAIPLLCHFAGHEKAESHPDAKIYTYPSAKSSKFVIPGLPEFDSTNEAVAHTRNLTFLKKYIRGLDFDLEAIWEEHTYFEFAERSVSKTMATMVQEPYVNHITTMTGGIGRASLTNFYRNHFIPKNPKDMELLLVSRTIGIDRVCDEFVAKFTHDMEIDWLAPGIPPTGRKVELPCTSVVCVRGDRLYHEHIAWDQASLLIQLGLMPEYLPYPYALPDGSKPGPGKKFEYKVPAAGVETSMKMLDKNRIPSNGMFEYKVREVDA
ncbi:uncharacterized protein Z519_10190 [Cladophialophora bantiana CBS 173.52]|uniref:Carboxymethylenebutenolidase n=1 Tax=Cladophialophora bantiana (strain ATCC 10958 / CBS 173.52 / CDC B-1940 / NIH 8579) TaxID=1442370 RepID=A0A0D2EH13_CLAB1|nr:uncharacterized protein Z519_10190 [Cladophialophora bantiana CBS 173.52]KIW89336.1 hypothetical protein Z519_10190 [Cladophialophora bantiana CBS 173.52]